MNAAGTLSAAPSVKILGSTGRSDFRERSDYFGSRMRTKLLQSLKMRRPPAAADLLEIKTKAAEP